MGQSVGGTPARPLPLGCRFSSGRWGSRGKKVSGAEPWAAATSLSWPLRVVSGGLWPRIWSLLMR